MDYLNSRQNIISGPRAGDYWFHSRGLETPEYREEGPFPIQGNIGSLLKQEQLGNYMLCEQHGNSIGGGPNCTGVFNGDYYTTKNTCGSNCDIRAPELYGIQSFGMINGETSTNIHGLHAYQNVRAGSEGKGPSSTYGCYEFVPDLQKTNGNSCQLNYTPFESATVGDWTKLPQAQSIVDYTYTNK
jgi:hypothetical protein